MKNKKKILLVSLSLSILFVLSGCKSEKEKKAEEFVMNKDVLLTYDEDLAKPIIQGEKSSEEVIADLVKKELDYKVIDSYQKFGFSNEDLTSNIGKKLISDDTELPRTPSLSKASIDYINNVTETANDDGIDLNDVLSKFNAVADKEAKNRKDNPEQYEKELKDKYKKELKESQEKVGKEVNKKETYEGS